MTPTLLPRAGFSSYILPAVKQNHCHAPPPNQTHATSPLHPTVEIPSASPIKSSPCMARRPIPKRPMSHYAGLWLPQQRVLKEDLVTARSATDTGALPRALARAMARYETYYRARADAIREDPTRLLCTAWATPLERSMQWIAGWRPSMFIHLIHSESGLRFRAQLDDLLAGVHSGDLGDLSPNQLARVDEVQRRAVVDEEKIADEMVELQAGVADSFPPADSELEEKLWSMERVIWKADDLRMRTLKDVVEFLEPLQVADLLVAAADLEIGIREVGMQLKFGQ